MLDAYVIEEIKRRERDKGRDDRPSLELPVPPPAPAHRPERGPGRDPDPGPDHDGDRGVVIIDYTS